jgi:hypothetical protein
MNGLIQTPLAFNVFNALGTTKDPGAALNTFDPTLKFVADVAALQSLDATTYGSGTIAAGSIAGGLNAVFGFSAVDRRIRRLTGFSVFSTVATVATMNGHLTLGRSSPPTSGLINFTMLSDRMAHVPGAFPMWASRFTADQQILCGSGDTLYLWLDTLTGVPATDLNFAYTFVEWTKTSA